VSVEQIFEDLARGVSDQTWIHHMAMLTQSGFTTFDIGLDDRGGKILEIVTGPGRAQRVARDARGLWVLLAPQQ
jgi:hypothetical protein